MTTELMDQSSVVGWRRLASCAQHDSDLFFPVGETGQSAARIATAKRVCTGCPVRHSCLSYALETNQRFGIWGGLTEEERRPVRRRWLAVNRRLAS